jgi:uncharacterized LabA/DUF88 family protein
MATFNTAIFYDIENLLKGYNFTQQLISQLSLKEILVSVKQTQKLGEIALQRAYANWSDPRLSIMRGEINELGIEPIQVFGFSQEAKKNAADLQLAIDAVDLAHIRPALEVFVIVSGDGGFAALAKKLHEYGRTVIGCGYKQATNRIFRAVCDDFVWLSDPDEDDKSEKATYVPARLPPTADPRVLCITSKVKRLTRVTFDTAVAKTGEVITWFIKEPSIEIELQKSGVHLSVLRDALSYAIPNFQPIVLGFPKFIECLQFACRGTNLCIVRRTPTEAMLMLRPYVPAGYEILPDLERRDTHSEENYRAILAAPGGPIFRFPDPASLSQVIAWVITSPLQDEGLGIGIERATSAFYPNIDADMIKQAFLALVNAGAFERQPEGIPLSEQRLTLKKSMREPKLLSEALYKAAYTKLSSWLPQVHDELLAQIIRGELASAGV